jgi:hypothetical protein
LKYAIDLNIPTVPKNTIVYLLVVTVVKVTRGSFPMTIDRSRSLHAHRVLPAISRISMTVSLNAN